MVFLSTGTITMGTGTTTNTFTISPNTGGYVYHYYSPPQTNTTFTTGPLPATNTDTKDKEIAELKQKIEDLTKEFEKFIKEKEAEKSNQVKEEKPKKKTCPCCL
jgi:uncharacterized membrane protein YukC